MDEKQKAIKSSSKVIAIIMKIGYIAMIVEMCICISGLIFVAITKDTSLVTSFGITIIAADKQLTTTQGVIATSIAALIMSVFLFAIFYMNYRMFNEINKTCTPFNPKYVKTIKIVAILVVLMTVVGNIVDSVAASYANVSTLGMDSDISSIIFGVIIYCLAYIFDYGCSLQKQSDETL